MPIQSYIQVNDVITDISGLPDLLTNDAMVSSRTMFLADAYYSECYPSRMNPPTGAKINDLKTKTPLHVLTETGDVTFSEPGSFVFPTSNSNYFTIGTTSDFPLSPTVGTGAVFISWIKRFDNTNYGAGMVFQRGISAATASLFQFYLSVGPNSLVPAAAFSNGSSIIIASMSAPGSTSFASRAGKTDQLAMAIENGFVKLFYNGVLDTTSSTSFAGSLAVPTWPITTGKPAGSQPSFRGEIKRWGAHYTYAVAGQTAADIVAAEYAAYGPRLRAGE